MTFFCSLFIDFNVGAPGFEPGVTCTQNRYVSRYTTLRYEHFKNLQLFRCVIVAQKKL